MNESRVIGSVTVHVCSECNHKHTDHATTNKRCSMEWCVCTRSQREVSDTEEAVERPVFAVAGGGR